MRVCDLCNGAAISKFVRFRVQMLPVSSSRSMGSLFGESSINSHSAEK